MKFLWEHKWILLLVLVLLISMTLAVTSLLSPGMATGISNVLGSVLRPLQSAVGSFNDWFDSLWGSQALVSELQAENQKLREHTAQVDEQARIYEQTLAENERLRDLLGLSQRRQDFTFVAATVLAKDLDNYSRTFTLSRGSQHGVTPGMMAVTEAGYVVGVVSEVGINWSTLRTSVDADFVCGAYAYRPGLDGVCKGQFSSMHSNETTLIGMTPDMDIRIGDVVLTSGVGGLYPRDLELGYVKDVQYDMNGMTMTAILTPMVELKHVEQVFLILSFESED